MTQQPTPQTERHASSRDARDVFLDALRQVCYLSPEQEQAIYKRMQDNNEFYVATGRDAAPFLEVVLQRHQEKHASLNICHYGNMRTGKSHASLFVASTFDPTFTVDHVVFDLAQMQILLPRTTPGSIYIVDDVRERYGLGSKSEVVNTQTFLETAAKSGTCLIFNSPTVKFTTGLKYFLEFLGYCDTFSLAIVYAKAIIFKNDRQVETLDPIGFIKFPKPTHLQPLIDAYEAKKDAFIAEIRKKAGGSGTNIIDARIDYIRSEVDFRQCSDLQDYQDEITLWDHTLPSTLVSAMARKIRRFYKKQREEAAPVAVPPTGQGFRDFVLANTTETLQRIITLYKHPAKQETVAEQLNLGDAARVSEQLNTFTEKRLGDLYEIWCKKGAAPAREGEVDGWEDGLPTNYKATYQRTSRFAIPIEKLQPELLAAETQTTSLRIRVFNLYYDEELSQDVTPQALRRSGSVVFRFGQVRASEMAKPRKPLPPKTNLTPPAAAPLRHRAHRGPHHDAKAD